MATHDGGDDASSRIFGVVAAGGRREAKKKKKKKQNKVPGDDVRERPKRRSPVVRLDAAWSGKRRRRTGDVAAPSLLLLDVPDAAPSPPLLPPPPPPASMMAVPPHVAALAHLSRRVLPLVRLATDVYQLMCTFLSIGELGVLARVSKDNARRLARAEWVWVAACANAFGGRIPLSWSGVVGRPSRLPPPWLSGTAPSAREFATHIWQRLHAAGPDCEQPSRGFRAMNDAITQGLPILAIRAAATLTRADLMAQRGSDGCTLLQHACRTFWRVGRHGHDVVKALLEAMAKVDLSPSVNELRLAFFQGQIEVMAALIQHAMTMLRHDPVPLIDEWRQSVDLGEWWCPAMKQLCRGADRDRPVRVQLSDKVALMAHYAFTTLRVDDCSWSQLHPRAFELLLLSPRTTTLLKGEHVAKLVMTAIDSVNVGVVAQLLHHPAFSIRFCGGQDVVLDAAAATGDADLLALVLSRCLVPPTSSLVIACRGALQFVLFPPPRLYMWSQVRIDHEEEGEGQQVRIDHEEEGEGQVTTLDVALMRPCTRRWRTTLDDHHHDDDTDTGRSSSDKKEEEAGLALYCDPASEKNAPTTEWRQCIEHLLRARVNVDSINGTVGPLHVVAAADFARFDVALPLVDALIARGARHDATDDHGATPLQCALEVLIARSSASSQSSPAALVVAKLWSLASARFCTIQHLQWLRMACQCGLRGIVQEMLESRGLQGQVLIDLMESALRSQCHIDVAELLYAYALRGTVSGGKEARQELMALIGVMIPRVRDRWRFLEGEWNIDYEPEAAAKATTWLLDLATRACPPSP